ncbi:MAG: HAD-IB family phosphatase [Candidatus Pacebacteria bacterium]|nr:HAD-IB family phosphatase [Candidatus Paceibacterota bacterium]
MRKVAIFDIDGTIFRSSLLIELVDVLIEKGIFPVSVRADYEQEKVRWLDRNGDYDSYIAAVVEVYIKNIKGVQYQSFLNSAKIVVDRYRYRTYRFTEDLIKELKKQNYYLLAISNSPKGILDLFCKELGFDMVYGRFYELGPTDRFTGKIEDEHLIANKANILRRAVKKNDLTLEGSVGVGDTESDIPFLELTERSICFNPNMMLYKHGKRNGWEVVVERKDVIYKVNKKN